MTASAVALRTQSQNTRMARVLPRSPTNVRRFLLKLLALGLVLRIGGACEEMVATPTAAAHQSHCADMPTKPGKPAKTDVTTCALCVALPNAALATVDTVPPVAIKPLALNNDRLAGLTGGPAPPPPKIV